MKGILCYFTFIFCVDHDATTDNKVFPFLYILFSKCNSKVYSHTLANYLVHRFKIRLIQITVKKSISELQYCIMYFQSNDLAELIGNGLPIAQMDNSIRFFNVVFIYVQVYLFFFLI